MASIVAAEDEETRAKLADIFPSTGNFLEFNLDEMCKRWASLPELPLETATDEQKEKVEILRANVMKAKGITAPPNDWTRHHYLRGQMFCYLKARNGDVELGTKRALECIDFMDTVYKKAVEYDSYPKFKRDLWEKNMPQGHFGKDKRGASVLYFKYGKSDQGALVRNLGFDFFVSTDWKRALYYWDTLFQESIDQGVFLEGRTWVLDCEGISYTKILRSRWIAPKQKENFPGGEQYVESSLSLSMGLSAFQLDPF